MNEFKYIKDLLNTYASNSVKVANSYISKDDKLTNTLIIWDILNQVDGIMGDGKPIYNINYLQIDIYGNDSEAFNIYKQIQSELININKFKRIFSKTDLKDEDYQNHFILYYSFISKI